MKQQNIYRFHEEQSDGWRFTYSHNPNEEKSWKLDGVSFQCPLMGADKAVPVFRYRSDQSKTYGGWRFRFSTDPNLKHDGANEGVQFYVFEKAMPNTVPIYEHRYKQSDGTRYLLTQNNNPADWEKVGIAFWAYPGDIQ